MHCIPCAFSQCFMHLDVCLYVENCVLIGLDWVEPMMQFFFLHVTCSCIFHTYIPFLFYLFCGVVIMFSVSLPLSLSQIVCAWHPSVNPLPLRTLFILGLLLLTPLLFTFGSMMKRPIRTSRRTSPDVVFVWSATWFYRTFPILLYSLSFAVGDGNLSVRYP